MPSPVTKIHLSFGLGTVPVDVYSAAGSEASVSFVRIHTPDGGRVRNQAVCSREGTVVPPHEEVRGYRPRRVSSRCPTPTWRRSRSRRSGRSPSRHS
ncbi:Ku protein [Streptomyces lydicus]|uniref:Ku protein n=1 Tax=Streptomyces lydicus TaxID=47763 RepID=UPI0033F3EA44